MANQIEPLPEVPLDREGFFESIVGHLGATLEDVVGAEEASGYLSVVAGQIGETINGHYVRAIGADKLSLPQVAAVLVDLKQRIGGDFYIIDVSPERIVLGNRRCPLGEIVKGRSSLCMMTSNVFGRVVADNLGYARVELKETIAEGSDGCRVLVHLVLDENLREEDAREYFAAD